MCNILIIIKFSIQKRYFYDYVVILPSVSNVQFDEFECSLLCLTDCSGPATFTHTILAKGTTYLFLPRHRTALFEGSYRAIPK